MFVISAFLSKFVKFENFKLLTMKRVFLRILYAAAAAAFLLSCVEDAQEAAPVELTAPSISVEQSLSGDSFTVEWASVPNAVSYAYSLNGATEVSTAELSVTFSEMEPGSYNVRVKAVAADGGGYLDSQWGNYDFDLISGGDADSDQVRLDKPVLQAGNVTEDSFTVSWSEVDGASGYAYSLDGGEETTVAETEVVFTGMTAGDYRVRVKARAPEGSALADSYWAGITVTVSSQDGDQALDKPVLRVENQTANSFTVAWYAVDNASYYMYRLNGGELIQTYETSVEFNEYAPGEYTVEVKAVPAEGTMYEDSEWASLLVTIADSEDPDNPDDPDNPGDSDDPEDPEVLDITGYYRISDGESVYEYMIEQVGTTAYNIHTPFLATPFTAERDGNTLSVNSDPLPTDLGQEYGVVDIYMFAYHQDYSTPEDETYYLWTGEAPMWEFDTNGVTLVNGVFIGFESAEQGGWLSWQGSAMYPGTYMEKYDPDAASAASLSVPGPLMLTGAVVR